MAPHRTLAVTIAAAGYIATLLIVLMIPTGYGAHLTAMTLVALVIAGTATRAAWHLWDLGFAHPGDKHPAQSRPSARV
jgi:hypothetical protein